MSWNAVDSLRFLLSDGPKDKRNWKKRCVGACTGTTAMGTTADLVANRNFSTFEFRRLTDFTGPDTPLGVYVNDILATVSEDDPESGNFTLLHAPLAGSRVEASYYTQWFTDEQLDSFLKSAANFILSTNNYTSIVEGLRPATLKYAAADAYQELTVRYARLLSETFRMEDLPHESLKATMDSYAKIADLFRKEAQSLRDDFYKRQGRREQVAFGTIRGSVQDVKPNK